jgi:hypothetical protein
MYEKTNFGHSFFSCPFTVFPCGQFRTIQSHALSCITQHTSPFLFYFIHARTGMLCVMGRGAIHHQNNFNKACNILIINQYEEPTHSR